MFSIIGIVVVLVCVIGGYVLHHGNLAILVQPTELLIIGGAAAGAFLIASPKKVISMTMKGFGQVFSGKEATKQNFMDLLFLLYDLLNMARKEGVLAIESHVNNPENSTVFSKYPTIISNHGLLDFICDNFKVLLAGNMESHELENIMDIDMEAHHHHNLIASHVISNIADGMPALGIVAAVLGVIITMGKIKEPPEVLGHSIGAALVGTFLGVLMSYGFIGPMAKNLEHQANEKQEFFMIVKVALLSFAKGWAPVLSVEAARRAVAGHDRPSFDELEQGVRGARK